MTKFAIIFGILLLNNIYVSAHPVELDRSTHYHSTTRGFQRMVFKHQGIWFAFYGNGIDALYTTSVNEGIDWSPSTKIVSAPNGSSSIDIILEKDTVYFFYVKYPVEYSKELYEKNPPHMEVKKGKIMGRTILWEEPNIIEGMGGYTSVTNNSNGFFYMVSRVDDPNKKVIKVVFTKNREPHDISSWEIPRNAINLEKDTHFASDIVAMDGNKAYIITKADSPGKLYGNLYDGKNWGKTDIFLSNMTNVAGDDRRMSAEFDSKNKKIHLVYVDRNCALIYRTLSYPFKPDNWSDPIQIVSPEVYSAVLSIDEDSEPVNLIVSYGKFDGKSEQIYLKKFNEISWNNDPVLVSEGKGCQNVYPSAPRNFSDSENMGVLYQKIEDKDSGSNIRVMFSVIDKALFNTSSSVHPDIKININDKAKKKIKDVTRIFPIKKEWQSDKCMGMSIDSKGASYSEKKLPVRISWGREIRMLLSFPDVFGSSENQIPLGAKIKKATLSLRTSSEGTEGSIFFCRVIDPDRKGMWKKKGFWQGADWKYRDIWKKIPWADFTQGGGTYSPDDIISLSNMSSNKWYHIDVTQHVQAWSDGSPIQGWLIKTIYDDGHDLQLYSCPADIENRPKLSITFEMEE